MKKERTLRMTLPIAVLTLIVVAGIMAFGLAVIKLDTMVTFILSVFAVCVIAICCGMSVTQLSDAIVTGCRKAILTIIVLVAVGMIVGSWIISGIIPTIIYYGLKIFTPSTFLLLGFWVCCIVSFFTGSSYSAVATLGVAFMAIGYGMNINPALVAGMSVSGAVFGDKMSPFSDTTNLAPGVAETDIFLHIKSMIWTIVPSFIISSILYFILGLQYTTASEEGLASINEIVNAIGANFTVNPLLMLVPAFTVVLVIKKMPPVIALSIGAFLGAVAALIAQPQFTLVQILESFSTGFSADYGVDTLNSLLNRGGISSMTTVIVYNLFTLSLGEIMSQMKVLEVLLEGIKEKILKPRSLIISTLLSCLFSAMLTTSQNMAIVLPGEVFKGSFKKARVAPYILSRTLEDGGTIFAFLVPWATCSIYVEGVLGLGAAAYAPYAFLCLLCPIFAIIYAITGIGVYDIDGNSLRGKTGQVAKEALTE